MLLIDAPHITIPAGLTPTLQLQLLLRWVHFVAGITWVGLLYFFTLVNAPFLQEVEGATRLLPQRSLKTQREDRSRQYPGRYFAAVAALVSL